MRDLIVFLRARLDEDESIAQACTPEHDKWQAFAVDDIAGSSVYDDQWRLVDGVWYTHNDPMSSDPTKTGPAYINTDRIMEHIARHDPARILRRVAADRLLIAALLRQAEGDDGEWGCGHSAEQIEAGQCPDIRYNGYDLFCLLALPYAGHSDYRSEWNVTSRHEARQLDNGSSQVT